MSRFVRVGKEGSVRPGLVKRVFSRDRRIAVFNDQGTLRAVDDTCTHVGRVLVGGAVRGRGRDLSVARRAFSTIRRTRPKPSGLPPAPDLPGAGEGWAHRSGSRRRLAGLDLDGAAPRTPARPPWGPLEPPLRAARGVLCTPWRGGRLPFRAPHHYRDRYVRLSPVRPFESE